MEKGYETNYCDVLVVGSEGASLAAIEAKETLKRGKVVLAVKGALWADAE